MLENVEVIEGGKFVIASFRDGLVSEMKFVLFREKLILFKRTTDHIDVFNQHKDPADTEHENFLGAGKVKREENDRINVEWGSITCRVETPEKEVPGRDRPPGVPL